MKDNDTRWFIHDYYVASSSAIVPQVMYRIFQTIEKVEKK